MPSKSDLINLLAQAIVANPVNRLHRGTEEVIARRLTEALTDLGGKTVFKTGRGYLYNEDGIDHGGVAEFVADLRQDGGYLFAAEGSGEGAALDPARLAGLSPVEKMKMARRAEQPESNQGGNLHPSYVAWRTKQDQAKSEPTTEGERDKGLNFM